MVDDELLLVYPHGGMIHLCGSHTQYIPVWREMKFLRAVETIVKKVSKVPKVPKVVKSK